MPWPGIEPGTFRSSVWRSPNWAIAAVAHSALLFLFDEVLDLHTPKLAFNDAACLLSMAMGCNLHGAHGVVVSHPLRMRKALGSIPSVSIFWMRAPDLQTGHKGLKQKYQKLLCISCISGLVAEYIVAIDVTRVRFPADAYVMFWRASMVQFSSL